MQKELEGRRPDRPSFIVAKILNFCLADMGTSVEIFPLGRRMSCWKGRQRLRMTGMKPCFSGRISPSKGRGESRVGSASPGVVHTIPPALWFLNGSGSADRNFRVLVYGRSFRV